jgi:peptidoglycan/LPS O-acetylase OafA/YrhL
VSDTTRLYYQPRLDGIRAIAVLLVLETHFSANAVGRFSFGAFGVRLFFALSGYLISRIIFEYRYSAASLEQRFTKFYWRRSLRLYPPLIMTILATSALGIAQMQRDWPWHLFYLTNIKVFIDADYGPAGPLWSLAVEEQFYLLWFPIMLLIPRKHLLTVIVGAIATGFIFKLLLGPFVWVSMLLPANIDFLGLGALLAYSETFDIQMDKRFTKVAGQGLILFSLLCLIVLTKLGTSRIYGFVDDTATAAFAFCLICAARSVSSTPFLRFLEAWPLVHIGRISYGIYIYHYFIGEYLEKIGAIVWMKQSIGGRPLMLATEVILTIAFAEISWRMMELPISKFKSREAWRSQSAFSA